MESLAALVAIILLVLLVLSLSTVVFCALSRFGKVPRLVGHIALGVQAIATLFTYQLVAPIGNLALTILAVCAVLMFLPKTSKIK
jgi:hypothetical protein